VSAGKPFNPLDKRNLAESVADALLARPVEPLPPMKPFEGAGVYAIYYIGSFDYYRVIAERNRGDRFDAPIYVGEAIPAGARKGGFGLDAPAGKALFKRLVEHAKSIEQANNLGIKDFRCRHLVVDDIWIPLGENMLIQKFQPIWNRVIDGFGNHDPGGGRYKQQRSQWDMIHPGRPWAAKCLPNEQPVPAVLKALKGFLG